LYFENSLEKQDLALLPAASTTAHVEQEAAGAETVDAAECARIAWHGPADVDGRAWPVRTDQAVIMPIGKHRLTVGSKAAAVELSDFNGEMRNASVSAASTDLAYVSRSRAVAMVASKVSMIEVDGTQFWKAGTDVAPTSFMLPAGQHLVTFYR
jgi:hypothetical protein